MDPGNSQRLWTGGSKLWRTSDGAANWAQASASLAANGLMPAIAVAPSSADFVLAGDHRGRIHRTNTGTTSTAATVWADVLPRNGYVSWVAFDPADHNIAYATYSTFGGTHVWKSANAGASWTPLDGTAPNNLPDVPVHCIVVDPANTSRLFIGTDVGVFTSIDGGANWAVENTGFPNVITESLSINTGGATRFLFAFTHGRGAYRVILNGSGGCPTVTGLGSTLAGVGSTLRINGTGFVGATAVKFFGGANAAFTVDSDTQITATVPAGAFDGPIAIGKTGCPDALSAAVTICPNPAVTLSADDNSIETFFGANVAATLTYVNRLTPSSYPATLSQVTLYFASVTGVSTGAAFTVLAGANLDGDTNVNGSISQTISATVQAVNAFNTYNVTPITIDSGDFVVGFTYTLPAGGGFPVATDLTPPHQGRSYNSGDGVNFIPFGNAAAPRNLVARATVFQGLCGAGCMTPAITTQPVSQTVCAGEPAVFSVAANGTGPFTYQWRKNGTNIPGATGSSLNFATVASSDAGLYDVAVSGACGNVASNAALLTVNTAPVVTTQPLDQTVCPGANATFTAAASGSPSPAVQWQVSVDGANYADLPGATSATLTLPAVTAMQNGTRYRAIFTNSCGAINSSPALLNVNAFTISPTNQGFPSGGGAGSVSVMVAGACGWTAASNDAWIAITSAPSGSGNGSVSYSVARHTGANPRTGTVTIAGSTFTVTQNAFAELEADVAPRPAGSGAVVVSDWVQVGRFSVGLDTPAQGSEFQRADCAPRATLGDGRITVADWVQAGRYSVGLDPPTPAGGPQMINIISLAPLRELFQFQPAHEIQITRLLPASEKGFLEIAVELVARGGENGLGFTFGFDPRVLRYQDHFPGRDASLEATVIAQTKGATLGRLGFGVALRPGSSLGAGQKEILVLRFRVRSRTATAAKIEIGDGAAPLALADVEARALLVKPVLATINLR
jgi:hypothetical protein